MKELYIAPEVEIVCFAPIERLATGDSWNWPGISMFSDSGDTDDSDKHIIVTDPTYGDPDTDGDKD